MIIKRDAFTSLFLYCQRELTLIKRKENGRETANRKQNCEGTHKNAERRGIKNEQRNQNNPNAFATFC
jgi:hypothetical protein